jgi:hypothetical protein
LKSISCIKGIGVSVFSWSEVAGTERKVNCPGAPARGSVSGFIGGEFIWNSVTQEIPFFIPEFLSSKFKLSLTSAPVMASTDSFKDGFNHSDGEQ